MNGLARFLFDECLGRPMMEQLQALIPAGSEFAHVLDYFAQGTYDDVWIPAIQGQGWVVVSTDGGKNRPSKGGKLPQLCREHQISHVLFSAKLHQQPAAIKLAALRLVWDDMLATHQAPPGSRFRLRYQTTRQGGQHVALVLVEP